jgi:peptidoglycan-associated lipoprotein
MKKILLISLLVSVLAACSTTPVPDETAGAPVESRSSGGSSSEVKPVVAGGLDASGLPRELTDPKSQLAQRSIFFDVDKYEVKGEYQSLVAAHAKFLVANRGYKVLIQGNTDETGSREYNLSLGQKRSDAVKRALVLLGAQEDQVESVSLGEEKPRNPGRDEAAFAENRRADILYRAPDGRGEF